MSGFKALILIILLLFVCVCGYAFSLSALSAGVMSAAPFGQDKIADWMLGTPQPFTDFVTAGEAGHYMSIGTKAFTGYKGPESFMCAPLVQTWGVLLTDSYGTYRGEGYLDHTGIDYGMNYLYKEQGHYIDNQDVITPMSGIVTFTGSYNGWGNTLIIENNGYQVLYGHATEINVQVGDTVDAGDIVMTVGGDNNDWRDGNSSGAHLHFEVRECDPNSEGEDAICRVVDPNATLLPGQTQTCSWNDIHSTVEIPAESLP
ncbi:MAG: M23 family metallopeptidase [Anaerolineaceae bacterium]